MTPAAAALVLYVCYLGGAFGVRSVLMRIRTGSSGYLGLSGRVGSARWWGGVLFAAALVAGLAAPAFQLAGFVHPFAILDNAPMHVTGLALTLLGATATLLAQRAMGLSWRIGVDEHESTEFVRSGLFAIVRNPFFTALLATAAGLFLLAPNAISLTALAALTAAIELQVRAVEEPHLTVAHGESYRTYAATTGRFVPGIGRLRS